MAGVPANRQALNDEELVRLKKKKRLLLNYILLV
jgi:hypothetical protein